MGGGLRGGLFNQAVVQAGEAEGGNGAGEQVTLGMGPGSGVRICP